MTHYLFLAIPNYCGSTLLHELIKTSANVASLKRSGDVGCVFLQNFVEGDIVARGGYKNLCGPRSIEANMEHVYADPANYDWPLIKNIWDANWEKYHPNATVRMQKTPADIFRIPMIVEHFDNLKWILSVRNPYAYVESIMRKSTFGIEPLRHIDQICFHVLRVMEIQIQNAQFLGENAYVMTYEDFVARPEYHREQMGQWMPDLEKMDLGRGLMIKGDKALKIADDSESKIQNMINEAPDIIERINHYFEPCEYLLNAWGYDLRHE